MLRCFPAGGGWQGGVRSQCDGVPWGAGAICAIFRRKLPMIAEVCRRIRAPKTGPKCLIRIGNPACPWRHASGTQVLRNDAMQGNHPPGGRDRPATEIQPAHSIFRHTTSRFGFRGDSIEQIPTNCQDDAPRPRKKGSPQSHRAHEEGLSREGAKPRRRKLTSQKGTRDAKKVSKPQMHTDRHRYEFCAPSAREKKTFRSHKATQT